MNTEEPEHIAWGAWSALSFSLLIISLFSNQISERIAPRKSGIVSSLIWGSFIVISMRSGIEMRFPVAANPRLAAGTSAQLNNIEVSRFGLHWPELDEDLSLSGIAQGDHGQHSRLDKRG